MDSADTDVRTANCITRYGARVEGMYLPEATHVRTATSFVNRLWAAHRVQTVCSFGVGSGCAVVPVGGSLC